MSSTDPQSGPFFNVMPEAAGAKTAPASPNPRKVNAAAADSVFGASVTPQTPSATSITMSQAPKRGFFSRRAVIIPIVIILLAGAGIAAWLVFFSKDEVNEAPPVNTAPIEPVGDPDVTTPGDWLARYFGAETCTIKTTCGDTADPDRDGLTNKEEFEAGADPNNPDSDSDGIADGDEKHIFGSEPLVARTYREGSFNDSDFVKGGFDINTNVKYTDVQLADIRAKIKEKGLHQPTLTTIGELAFSMYDFQDPNSQGLEGLNIDLSPQAKLDRDTQRQATIKKIGSALIKYRTAVKTFPRGNDFIAMTDAIASYNTVATNYNDPINKQQYVYGYAATADGGDFTLSYYSETQNQLIKYTAKNAEETEAKESSQMNDQMRIADLENIKSALMIYSTANTDSQGNQAFVFPTKEQYPSVLIPRYITALPKDPNGQDYVYEVGPTYNTFTLKATLQAPPAGTTGYLCDQDSCRNF